MFLSKEQPFQLIGVTSLSAVCLDFWVKYSKSAVWFDLIQLFVDISVRCQKLKELKFTSRLCAPSLTFPVVPI